MRIDGICVVHSYAEKVRMLLEEYKQGGSDSEEYKCNRNRKETIEPQTFLCIRTVLYRKISLYYRLVACVCEQLVGKTTDNGDPEYRLGKVKGEVEFVWGVAGAS